jgi:hypothetical protein
MLPLYKSSNADVNQISSSSIDTNENFTGYLSTKETKE